jgi:hypothetical protein
MHSNFFIRNFKNHPLDSHIMILGDDVTKSDSLPAYLLQIVRIPPVAW